jgi:hypothetical protein
MPHRIFLCGLKIKTAAKAGRRTGIATSRASFHLTVADFRDNQQSSHVDGSPSPGSFAHTYYWALSSFPALAMKELVLAGRHGLLKAKSRLIK